MKGRGIIRTKRTAAAVVGSIVLLSVAALLMIPLCRASPDTPLIPESTQARLESVSLRKEQHTERTGTMPRFPIQALIVAKDGMSGSPIPSATVFFGKSRKRHSPQVGSQTVETGSDGSCYIEWPPATEADVICAQAEGYVTGRLSVDRVELSRANPIELTQSFDSAFICTLDQGDPVSEVVITISQTNPFPFRHSVGAPGCDPSTAVLEGTSGLDGLAVVKGAMPGRYSIACRHPWLIPVRDTPIEVNLTSRSVHPLRFQQCYAAVVESASTQDPIVASAVLGRKGVLQEDRGLLRTICSVMHKELVARHPGRVGIVGAPRDASRMGVEMKLVFASGEQLHHVEPLRVLSREFAPTRVSPPAGIRSVEAEIRIGDRSGHAIDGVPLLLTYHGVLMTQFSGRPFRVIPGTYRFSVMDLHAPALSKEIGKQELVVLPDSNTVKTLRVSDEYRTSVVKVEWPDGEQDFGVHVQIDEHGVHTLAYNWETPYRPGVLCLARPSRVRATTDGYTSGDWQSVVGNIVLRMTVGK